MGQVTKTFHYSSPKITTSMCRYIGITGLFVFCLGRHWAERCVFFLFAAAKSVTSHKSMIIPPVMLRVAITVTPVGWDSGLASKLFCYSAKFNGILAPCFWDSQFALQYSFPQNLIELEDKINSITFYQSQSKIACICYYYYYSGRSHTIIIINTGGIQTLCLLQLRAIWKDVSRAN